MLRMIQGIDQRLDTLLCGRMLSDGKGVYLGVLSGELLDRYRSLFSDALREFNQREGGIQISAKPDASASDSVVWRYWLNVGGGVGETYCIELSDNKTNYMLRLAHSGFAAHTKITYFDSDQLRDRKDFERKLFCCFGNVIGWSMYEDAFVTSWNECVIKNPSISILSCREPRAETQMGLDTLDEFTFKFKGQARFFIELNYDDERRELCMHLRDMIQPKLWSNVFLDAGSDVSTKMFKVLETAEKWSSG